MVSSFVYNNRNEKRMLLDLLFTCLFSSARYACKRSCVQQVRLNAENMRKPNIPKMMSLSVSLTSPSSLEYMNIKRNSTLFL